ncbi:MAG TPA: insulinase family protein, partial [Archangium sp.]
EEVRRNGISQQELNRARTRFETQMLAGLQSVGGIGGKADMLQNYNHYVNDPGFLGQDLARYDAVTTDKVRDFAREHLKPDTRVVLHAVPAQKGPISAAKETH